MELEAPGGRSGAERLALGRPGARQDTGVRGRDDAVAVPVEHGRSLRQRADDRVVAVHVPQRRPADLAGAAHLGARPYGQTLDTGEELSAQAHAQRRYPGAQRVGQEVPLQLQRRVARQVVRVHGAAHDDQPRQVGHRRQIVRRGARRVDQVADVGVEAAAVQRVQDQAGLLDLDVLEEQDGTGGHGAVSSGWPGRWWRDGQLNAQVMTVLVCAGVGGRTESPGRCRL